ncbi:MAG: adenylyltransferase/cytidyltransferase family protein [Lentisphaeria bacterium]|nr:PfkB family carbohydrate kinase [Lentisphaeria bacterium]NQZ68084.1 adenylyltransferase/cytidyltransferase family protein [Lentisphaeria bacterium]
MKLTDINILAEKLAELKAEGKTVVHCHGVFDLMHIGHIKHFQEAKGFGDILVVTVTPDEFVNKGPGRPVFTGQLRAEAIAALESVDYVAINQWPTAVETIKLIQADIFVKGKEFKDNSKDVTGNVGAEHQAIKENGGRIQYTDDVVFSSSHLINNYMNSLPPQVNDFLQEVKEKFSYTDFESAINSCVGLKVLVIGETIIDEYQYCQTMGKSGKEPILAALYETTEKSTGGVIAVANHLSQFVIEVDLLTVLGELNSHEDFINDKLSDNINATFIIQAQAPTIIKRRFIESSNIQKLFEIYEMNEGFNDETSQKLFDKVSEVVADYDLVIVVDYGHYMIDNRLVELLSEKSRFLAINTQKNAGNHGFNTVSKYPRADFISISEHELRLDARNKSDSLETLIKNTAKQLSCKKIIVTRGREGIIFYDDGEFQYSPAFLSKGKDRVGAGDAVFAISSLLAEKNTDTNIISLTGNLIGAQAIEIMGNTSSINKIALLKQLTHLLK